MTRFNLQAILFIFILLGLVYFIRPNFSKQKNIITINDTIGFTSVKANVKNFIYSTDIIKPDNVRAKSVVIKKLGDSFSFLKVGADQRWPIASVTKLMTATIALEKFPPNRLISFNDKIVITEGVSGGFQAGEIFTAIDLVKALMVVSSNDAAMALAETYGRQNFIDAMQIKAVELGMRQTTFYDPTGLSFLNQSTIDDLEKLIKYVFEKHPEIFNFSREKKALIGGKKYLTNINEFAEQPNFIGGKTGYTDDASGNLISLFHDSFGGGAPILIIVLGTDDRFGDTRILLDYFNNLRYNGH
ncbi:MAG: serine hydrolase [Patescibacteria group bacterium]